MSWSDWQYWKKLGVIGFFVGLISLIPLFFAVVAPDFFSLFGIISGLLLLTGGIILLGMQPWILIANSFCSTCGYGLMVTWFAPLMYFVYGAVIGGIYGMIKERI